MALDVDSLYRKYGPMVIRRCRALLADEEQALDAAQETFVKLIRYQDRLTDTAPSSMLYTMATNVCLNLMRSSRRRPLNAREETLERIASSED
ncbi:MAG TPA: sigma factor, partial [bacterium]|nr:sigma factor [bacterium]